MERVFVDTSAWYALADSEDENHERASRWYGASTLALVTSNFILDETVTLTRYRLGHSAAVQLGRGLRESGKVLLMAVEAVDEEAAWEQFTRRREAKLSYTDCTSFELMRRLGIRTAFTFDADFRGAGFLSLPSPD